MKGKNTMKKTLFVILSAIGCAAVAETSLLGIDSYAIGKNAGYNGSANRSVFVGPGAGAYICYADSNTVIGAAAALDAEYLYSSIGFGHYALRNAYYNTGLVAIGDQSGKSANYCTDGIFIGKESGISAESSNNSIFIGKESGKSSSSMNNSILIGSECGKSSYSFNNSIVIGSGTAKNCSGKSNSITIGNNLMPTNDTVNIGNRIVCNANGLTINGNFIEDSAGWGDVLRLYINETNAVTYTFNKSSTGIPRAYHSNSFPFWVNATVKLEKQINSPSDVYAAYSKYTVNVEMMTHADAGWNTEYWLRTNMVFTAGNLVSGQSPKIDTGLIERTGNGWTSDRWRVHLYSQLKWSFTATTMTIQVVNSSVNEDNSTGSTSITITVPLQPHEKQNMEKQVDGYPTASGTRRFVSSAGVANALNDKISGCAIKYESGALKVYTASGVYLGTLTIN